MNNKIAILCAADSELLPFIQHIENTRITEKAMLKFYEGDIFGIPVVALYSGVCKVNAAIAAQILIEHFNVSAIINAGAAGGIAENVKLFDTVVTTESAYHDVEEDSLTDFHPWLPSVWLPSDAALVAAAKKAAGEIAASGSAAANIHFGRTVSGEQFISDNLRDGIIKRFSPLSVDMETAALAHVAYVNRLPFIAVRAITDTAEHIGIDNFDKNCDKASEISKDFVLRMLRILSE